MKNYIYIKREDIKDLHAVVDGELKKIDSKQILSGSYVTTKKATPTVKGVAALRKRILDFARSVAEDEVKKHEKFVKKADLKALSDAGLTDEMIVAFYCGVRSVIDFKGDYEMSELSGIFSYRTDDGYIERNIKEAISNARSKKFELAFKYPDFNFKFLGKGTKKSIKGADDGYDTKHYDTWTFKPKPNTYVVAGKITGRTKDGEFQDLTYGSKTELDGGYLSFVSSNAQALFNTLKKCATQKEGYVKDVDWIVNKLGGVNPKALNHNKMKYAKGGSTYAGGGEITSYGLSFSKTDYDVNVNPQNLEVDVNIKESDSVDHYGLNDTDAEWSQHTWGYMVYPKSVDQLYDVLKALKCRVSKKRLEEWHRKGGKTYARGGSTSKNSGEVGVVREADGLYRVAMRNGNQYHRFNDVWSDSERAEKFAKKIASNHKISYKGVDEHAYEFKNSYAEGGEIKYSKDGYVKEIGDWNGKVIKELVVNGKKYRRNSVYGTYNSIDGNELLHKNDYKGGSTYAGGGEIKMVAESILKDDQENGILKATERVNLKNALGRSGVKPKKSIEQVLRDILKDDQENGILNPTDRVNLKNALSKSGSAYAKGGAIPNDIDLFEHYEYIPANVQKALDKANLEDGVDYDELANLKEKIEKLGFTFDYDLDAEPYNLRKVGTKGSKDFYKKGGVSPNGRVPKAFAGYVAIAQGIQKIAPKTVDAADTRLAKTVGKPSVWERMNRTSMMQGGEVVATEKYDIYTYNVRNKNGKFYLTDKYGLFKDDNSVHTSKQKAIDYAEYRIMNVIEQSTYRSDVLSKK